MSNAIIAGYARTPFHFARKGKLASVRPDDLAAIALRGLVARLGLDPAVIEDVVMGCAYPEGEQGANGGQGIATILRSTSCCSGSSAPSGSRSTPDISGYLRCLRS